MAMAEGANATATSTEQIRGVSITKSHHTKCFSIRVKYYLYIIVFIHF